MKVCHYIGTNLVGHYFKNLAEKMPECGVSLSYAALLDVEKPAWLDDYPKIKFKGLGAKSRFDYPAAIIGLAGFLRKEKIDILQIHLFDGGLTGIPAGRLAGVKKIIYTRHHTDLVHRIGKNYHIALDRWMARKSDKVVAVSQAVKDFMIEKDHIAPDKIEVVHLGFDFTEFDAGSEDRARIKKEFSLEDKFVIGCIASFQKIKGHEFLINSLVDIKEKIPEARLFLLGDGDRAEIENLIKNSELTENVIFAGYRSDIPACLQAMDVVVHPSLSEAFCQVIIEAMGAGTALIATDVGGAREVIQNGENAVLISPGDSRAIAENVIRLYRETEFRRKLAENGKISVRKKFTVERMIGEYMRIYKNLLN